ncbi:PGPGW domain-containing protein [Streptomyces sp. NPDC057438]|uniref:PGPGW domain-containing protein n=1 Tax=Streptomyces sp. NPDC057438 TaxID=3346133 RepID=UPI0036AA666D
MPERRIGTALAAVGAVVTAAGTALYVLPGPGLPVLVTGLAVLTTGLVMAAAGRHFAPIPALTRGFPTASGAGRQRGFLSAFRSGRPGSPLGLARHGAGLPV